MGRVVHGASCPWGELSLGRVVHGVSCLWGELSLGRDVVGQVLMGQVVRGASCLGTSGPGTVSKVNPNPCGWGRYDFRIFEDIYLCNGSSSDLQNSCVPRKTSREYILLNTLERKTAFLAIHRPKCARNRPFFRLFSLFRTAVKVYMTSPPPPQGRALPPPIVGAPSSSGAARTVSSSF
jgi:hypothetical protein